MSEGKGMTRCRMHIFLWDIRQGLVADIELVIWPPADACIYEGTMLLTISSNMVRKGFYGFCGEQIERRRALVVLGVTMKGGRWCRA
jgi:hypothetical protein